MTTWSCDVPVSRPVPPDDDQPVMVDFGGFGFTTGGIVHNLTSVDVERIFIPTYAPAGEVGHGR